MNTILHATSIWKDMSIWMRAYIYSAVAGIGSQEIVFGRLYRIPPDFANTFQLIFGGDIAQRYANLLAYQIIILREIVAAQISGNTAAASENTVRLYQNADARAAYLAQINPYWSEGEWRNLIRTYLGMTLDESTRIIARDYSSEIMIFERLLFEAGLIADYFSLGLYNYIMGGNTPR